MEKKHVLPSEVFLFSQECKREAKETEDYQDACRTIFTRLMALLLEAAADTIKARTEWLIIYENKAVPALRNTVMQAVSNTDSRLCTSLQAVRTSKTTFSFKQQREESVYNFYARCMTADSVPYTHRDGQRLAG